MNPGFVGKIVPRMDEEVNFHLPTIVVTIITYQSFDGESQRDMCYGWWCQFFCDKIVSVFVWGGENRNIGGLKLKIDLLDKNILGVCLK